MSTVISLEDTIKIVRKVTKAKSFVIADFSLKPFSEKVNGFNGEHLLLSVTTTRSRKPLRFFVKSHCEFQNTGTFAKEIAVFEEIFKKFREVNNFCATFAPRYYFGRDRSVLVFEDLIESGFTLARQANLNVLDLEHVKLPLEALAKLHAGSIAFEANESRKLGKKYSLIDDYSGCLKEPLFREDENWFRTSLHCLIALTEVFPQDKLSKDEFKKGLMKLAEESLEIMKPKVNMKNVLCHGDMWARNVLFKYEGDGKPMDCKLVDFHLTRYMVPAHDVLQWIYTSSSPEMRKHHIEHLLGFYYSCLKDEMEDIEDIFPLSEFVKGAEYVLPQIKLLNAFQYTTQGGTPEFYNKIFCDNEAYTTFLFKDRSGYALKQFATDNNYNRLITWALSDLCDFIKDSGHNATANYCY